MVKKLLTIILGLTLAAGASAQWGGNGNYPYPAGNIQFWTGSGSNSAVVVISWDDEDASYAPQGFAWGVHFNGTISAHNLLDTIAAYDPRFTFSFSSTLLSTIAYHDAANNVHLTPSIQYNCFNVNGTFAPDVYDNITISDGDMMEISESCYFDCTNVTPATVPGGSTPGTDTTATGCTPLVLDGTNSFLETFDTLGTTGNGVVPACWSTTHIAGSATALWTSYSASATSCHSGTRMMQLPDMQSGNITLLVAPVFSIANANQYQVSLWVKRTSSYSSKQNEGVKVWANSTPDTVGGTVLFHARRSITQTPAVSTEGWYEYTGVIPLTGTVYIVMEGISEYGASTYIDDFSVSRAPNCDDPTDLAFDPATSLVSWTAGNATQWQVRDGETLSVVNTPSYTNPAWQLATNYSVSVRSICGAGDTNSWRSSIDFTTPRITCLDTMPLPFSTTFSGYDYELSPYYGGAPLPDCWNVLSNGTNMPVEGSSSYTYYSGIGVSSSMNNYGCVTPNDPYFAFMAYAPYDGTYTTYINNMNQYGTRKFAVLPRFTHPLDQIDLSFDYSMNSRDGAELRIGYIVNDTSDFTSLYVVPNSYRTLAHVDHLDFATLSNTIPAGARLTMLWLTTDTVHTGTAPANFFCGIDNLTVDVAPDCKYPRDFVADSIGYHGFSLAWREVSTTPATEWQVAYGAAGFDPETEGTTISVSATTTTITGLTSDNDYDAYVRSACSTGGYTAWAGPVSVHTYCPQGGNVALGNEALENYTVAVANWGNTLCQSVFTATELSAAGLQAGDTISNLNYNWFAGTTARYTKAFSIYMTHTAVTEFPDASQASNWINVAATDLVLSDSLMNTASGLTRYDLATPFVWNGTDGIAITTLVNQPDGMQQSSTGVSAYSSLAPARRTLFTRRDRNAYSLDSLTTYSPTSTTYRATILIERPCVDTITDPVDPQPVPVEATIAASDILYWVGTGSNQAILAVNWADTALAWGYRFSGSATVADMMNDIAAADPRFSFSGTGFLDDITFNDGTVSLAGTPGNYWGSTNNGMMDAGLGQTLANGDLEKWGDPAAGVIVDSSEWGGVYYYTYAYPMTIHPVSVPDTTTPVDTVVVEATIAASDILYWVGTGSNEAILAVNWADTALAWGYRFSGSATVADMMNDIAAADPRFSYSGTGFLDDIFYIDTAAGMTDTLHITPGNYWGSTNNGISDMGMGQTLANGDLEKWADPAAGVIVDSASYEYGGENYWYYIYAYPMTIHPVTVPDTTGQGGPVVPEHGPFCGAVGTEGCDAIYTDSSAIVAWATGITVERGPVDITDPDGPRVHFGTDEMGLGAAGTTTTNAVSLGDGGIATLTFARPIANGEGPDFAVFENSWGDYFLELAFVEVSSDGERFVRFPATSLTPTDVQVGSNGFVDPTFINNLAGKYRVGYGTPFDLEELADSTGLDITRITHVRLIDVVGSIDPQYATYDAFGHMVNDPWPTNDTVYGSGGFDLTGVAVLHENTTGIDDIATSNISVWPNPATDMLNIVSTSADKARLMDINGRTVETYVLRDGRTSVSISHLPAGVYMLQIGSTISKIVKF